MAQDRLKSFAEEAGIFADSTIALAKAKPWLVLAGFFGVLLVYYYWLIFVILLAIFIVFLIALKIKYREPSTKELLEKKRILLDELKIAEVRMMQHKLDPKTFQELSEKNQNQLVEIEAKISNAMQKQYSPQQNVNGVSSRKRHVLKDLLEQQDMIEDEIKIAEQKYFKHKINAQTYSALLKEKQKQLIGLEAEIKNVYANESVDRIKKELEQKLKTVEELEKEATEQSLDEMADDVSEQEMPSE